MIRLILVIVIWVVPFVVINYFLYKDLRKGGTLGEYNWASSLLSLIPVVGFICLLIGFGVYMNDIHGDKIKNIKIK